MPEMFRHTIRSTAPDRPSRTLITRRDSGRPAAPIEVYGSTVAALNSFDAGYRCARPVMVADTIALACVKSTPGSSRPWMRTQSTVRSSRRFGVLPQPRVPLERNEEHASRRLKEVEVATKVVRRDADDRMRDAVDRQGLPDDVGVRCHRLLQKSWLRMTRGSADGASSIAGSNPGPARERHAERAEVVGRDVQRLHTRGRRLVRSSARRFRKFAGPPRDGHAGFGCGATPDSPDRTTFDRPLAGFRSERTDREHQEFGQPDGVDAARRRRDHASRRSRARPSSHANAERDDADQRENSILGERPCGMSQVAGDM